MKTNNDDDDDESNNDEKNENDDAILKNNNNNTAAAARGTLWSIGLRLLSFVCTQVTLRSVDPIALGKANIDLELAFGFILFWSREGYRLTLSKEWNSELAYTTRYAHIVLSILVWCSLSVWKNDDDDDDYRLASILYCIAASVEGWAEPLVLQFLFRVELQHKIAAEGIATVTKTLVTVAALSSFSTHFSVTAFGVAQLAYAVVYTIVLYRRASHTVVSATTNNKNKRRLSSQVLLFTIQGVFKHALTEGDRILLVLLLQDNAYDKGLYALASAYGGMAARLLFQPLEENARLLWSKLAVDKKNNEHALYDSYSLLLKLVSYIGLLFATLGTNYTHVLLRLLMRDQHQADDAAPVLSAFCVYTLAMALNGTSEAFWYAISSSPRDVTRLTVVHCVAGLLSYGILAPLLVQNHGTIGLVVANTCCMLLRSTYALSVARGYFKHRFSMRHLLPHPLLLTAFAMTFLTTRWSYYSFQTEPIKHVSVGVACFAGIASLAVMLERTYFARLRTIIRPAAVKQE